jgi:sugar O-acyltransferase (sialic acid O-acetyltransferase NeuD family)
MSDAADGAVLIIVPFLNANETEVSVAAVMVTEGEAVAAGDVLCEVESTKTVEEVVATESGWISGLRVREGMTVTCGDPLCWIAQDPDHRPAVPSEPDHRPPTVEDGGPPELKITEPARALAAELDVPLSSLPTGPLVTSEIVREAASAAGRLAPGPAVADAVAILVYGGGGHGRTLLDLLRSTSYRVVGIIDDGIAPGQDIVGTPVVGGADRLAELRVGGTGLAVNAVGGVSSISSRVRVAEQLERAGFVCPVLVHRSAVVEPTASLAAGSQVLSGAYVGSACSIGPGAIVNTGAIASHDCVIGPFAHLSPGAILAGGVNVGQQALVGMGVSIFIGVRIGAGARIGNGAIVNADVPDGVVVHAGGVWPR